MRIIDADELKQVVGSELTNDGYGVRRFTELIDNAPTVEENWKFYFDHGYAQAKKEFERPQSGWQTEIIEIRKYYAKCPYCEFSFEMIPRRELPYFCGACGRRLRGEEE